MNQSLIVLDRDGVINHDSENYIKSAMEWKAINGSLNAISRLKKIGWKVVVATNQSGIGRNIFSLADLHAIHSKMFNSLSQFGVTLDAVFFCPHEPSYNCDCRKPSPGMLLEISQRFEVDTESIIMVGDSHRDLFAAHIAGAKPYLVKTGNGEKTLSDHEMGKKEIPKNTKVFDSLSNLVDSIVS